MKVKKNAMTKTKIKKILQQHEIWLATKANEGKRANFDNADLKGADLEGANLSGASFQNATLNTVNLSNANLVGANLAGADLYGATLRGANFRDANLAGVILTCADLARANLQDANIAGANIAGSYAEQGSIGYSIKLLGDEQQLGFPDISWIIPGALCKLNAVRGGFICKTQTHFNNSTFTDGSLGLFIQDNDAWDTFDILVADKIIRGIPYWVKYTGLSRMPEYLG